MKGMLSFVFLMLFPVVLYAEYSSPSSVQIAEYQHQVADYDAQSKKTVALQKETERQLKESAIQQETLAKQIQ